MTPVPLLPSHIDSTMLTTYRACRKKFWWEYILGLRPRATSIDLHAGGAFSASLEAFYRSYYMDPRVAQLSELDARMHHAKTAAYRAFATEWGEFIVPDGHVKTEPAMWNAVETYLRAFPPPMDRVQPYIDDEGNCTIEYSFAIPLDFPGWPLHPVTGDPFIYSGRFDMLGHREGRVVWRDEKTSSRLERIWADKWTLRSQFMGYCWALTYCGIPCDTGVVRGVIITTKDCRIVEAVKQYPQHMIARWIEQVRRDLEGIVRSWNEDPERGLGFDYNFGDSCTSYGRICSYADLCSSLTPEQWMSDFVIRRWNPLDRNPIRETVGAS